MYNRDLISVALKQVIYRSVGNEKFSYMQTLEYNIIYIGYLICFLILLIVFYVEFQLILKMKKVKRNNLVDALPYFFISVIPLVWFFLIRDHSTKHSFFTYRILILTMIGFPLGIYYLFKDNPKG